MSAETSTSTVLEEPLDDLDIDSQSWGLDIGLRHPVFRGVGWKAGVSATLSRRHTKTSLLGVPFTFASGANEGVTDVAVIRLGQDLLVRDARRVIALRSTFNFGTNLFHATRNEGDLPDGQFVSWLGQAQLAHKPFDTEASLVARLHVQRTSRRLLPLEQFSIGGANSVRGYRENQFIRDEGVTASVEARIPLFDLGLPGVETETEPGPVALALFADTGWAWTTGAPLSRYEDIHSIGFGFRWDPSRGCMRRSTPHGRSSLWRTRRTADCRTTAYTSASLSAFRERGSRAKGGGPGRTRTCNQTVMSGQL